MSLRRIKADLKYILINRILIYFPSWHVRRFFLRLLGMKIGERARIALGTVIIQPESIVIGPGSVVNEYCHLDGRGGLTIGADVSVSIYSKIITASHRANSDDFAYYESEVAIEDNAWLGCGAIVLDGSHIRQGAIIGAGCVFKGEAEENTIYVGNPAKPIKKRTPNEKYHFDFKPYFR